MDQRFFYASAGQRESIGPEIYASSSPVLRLNSPRDTGRDGTRDAQAIFSKFISCLMKNGNQSVAKKILYNACMFAGSKTATAPPQKTEIAAYSAQRPPPRTKTKTKTETRSPFAGVLVQAVHNARPLIECSQGLDTNRTSRRPPSKAKPVPITSERANRLAIQ